MLGAQASSPALVSLESTLSKRAGGDACAPSIRTPIESQVLLKVVTHTRHSATNFAT